jgi:hypothetical protein
LVPSGERLIPSTASRAPKTFAASKLPAGSLAAVRITNAAVAAQSLPHMFIPHLSQLGRFQIAMKDASTKA